MIGILPARLALILALSGSSTVAQPPAVEPAASEVTLKPTSDNEAPANSLTVFRIRS